MNAFNGVWSDTYILQIINQQELKAGKDFCKKNMDF